jgi:hypothetical protein
MMQSQLVLVLSPIFIAALNLLWSRLKLKLYRMFLTERYFYGKPRHNRFQLSEAQVALTTLLNTRQTDQYMDLSVDMDDSQGREETLLDQGVESAYTSYDIATSGASPVHITHHPTQAKSQYWWDRSLAWYRFPLVWLQHGTQASPIWTALPPQVQQLVNKALQSFKALAGGMMQGAFNGGGGGLRSDPGAQAVAKEKSRVVISCFWWNAKLLDKLVNDAELQYERQKTHACEIRRNVIGGQWDRIEAPPRRMESIVMARPCKALVADVCEFFEKREWYRNRNIPYQRIYLLHGPPGTGKTSFLQALAITHGMRLYILQVSSQSMTKEALATLLAETAQDRCMVALEDAEKAFKTEEVHQAGVPCKAAVASRCLTHRSCRRSSRSCSGRTTWRRCWRGRAGWGWRAGASPTRSRSSLSRTSSTCSAR